MKIEPQDLLITSKLTFAEEQILFNKSTTEDVLFSLIAPPFKTEKEKMRPSIDIQLVIDISGSMDGRKIQLTKASLNFLIEQLRAGDKVSLVTFSDQIQEVFGFTEMNSEGKYLAKNKISLLKAHGSTNLSGGLYKGLEILNSIKTKNEVSTLLLLTDGMANSGITDTASLVLGLKNILETMDFRPSIFTFGFGSDHDVNMLRPISQEGKGLYYYLAQEDEIPTSFADCLGGQLSVDAQNITIKIHPMKGNDLEFLSTYKVVRKEDYYEISLGDLYSDESKDFIMKIKYSEVEKPGSYEIFHIQYSYFNVHSKQIENEILKITKERTEEITKFMKPNFELDLHKNRILTTFALEKARKLADEFKLTEARSILKEIIEKIKSSISCKDSMCIGLVEDLISLLGQMSDNQSYTTTGNKYLSTISQTHTVQRSTKDIFSSSKKPSKELMKSKSKRSKDDDED